MKKWIKRSRLLLLWLPLCSNAQDLPIGQWRSHFSYQHARILERGGEGIFCATEFGLFHYHTSNRAVSILDKNAGLSDIGITGMAFDESTATLVVGYASGLVDLVRSDGVRTVRDIRASPLLGDKRIEDVVCQAGRAYLATSFGVIVLDIASAQITENYRSIGTNATDVIVRDLAIIGDTLYASTSAGVQRGALVANLLDFNNWQRFQETAGQSIQGFVQWQGDVYALSGNVDAVRLTNGTWQQMGWATQAPIRQLQPSENLLVLSANTLWAYDGSQLTPRNFSQSFTEANQLVDANGLWIADGEQGLLSDAGERILPNGPATDALHHVRWVGDRLYAFAVPHPQQYDGQYFPTYATFDNSTWQEHAIAAFPNVTDAALYRGQVYLSSLTHGLYNLTTQTPVPGIPPGQSPYGPLTFRMESGSHLYTIAYQHDQPLYQLDREGVLTSFSAATAGTSVPTGLQLSQAGVVWVMRPGGINVLEPQSDQFRTLGTAAGLPSGAVLDVRIDRGDEAWVATAQGWAVFQDASFIFNEFGAISPVFDQRVLFENIAVTALAVDGGNRIWAATNEGIWIFDNNITRLENRFSTDNSPLPSNDVQEMTYNPHNGEMYLLTAKGLVSYRSNSSSGSSSHQSVRIFPNPVRPGYDGQVGISGLVTDAQVKITDINGKLVRQLQANGGTASWDLLDYNQARVASGVYVVFSANRSGEETYVGKLAVMR